MNVTLEQAQVAVQAAIDKSLEIGVKMSIAIVNSGTNLVAFARMDGA